MSRGNCKSTACAKDFESKIEEGQWDAILNDDPYLPWTTGFQCPKCSIETSSPITVKNGPHLALYCPYCKSFIKNANKKEKKFL